jgi:hypothetical protein
MKGANLIRAPAPRRAVSEFKWRVRRWYFRALGCIALPSSPAGEMTMSRRHLERL